MNACLQGHRERPLTNASLRSPLIDHRGSPNSDGGRIARLASIWFGTAPTRRGGAARHGAEASARRQPVSTWP
jgi:hypothetical protein